MYLNLQPVSKILDCNFGSSSSLPSLLILLLMMTKKREGKKKMMMMTMMSVGRNVLKEKTSCVLLVLSLFPLFLSLSLLGLGYLSRLILVPDSVLPLIPSWLLSLLSLSSFAPFFLSVPWCYTFFFNFFSYFHSLGFWSSSISFSTLYLSSFLNPCFHSLNTLPSSSGSVQVIFFFVKVQLRSIHVSIFPLLLLSFLYLVLFFLWFPSCSSTTSCLCYSFFSSDSLTGLTCCFHLMSALFASLIIEKGE